MNIYILEGAGFNVFGDITLDLFCCCRLVQGCFQICMNALLQGSSKHAPVFLQDGCRKLKAALELETLFLPTACPDTINNGAIYW